MTSVGEKKKKPTQFNRPSCIFLTFSSGSVENTQQCNSPRSKKNMSSESSVSGSGGNHNDVPYDYSDKKTN